MLSVLSLLAILVQKVQTLTLVVEHHALIEVLLTWDSQVNPKFTFFTSTKAQILTLTRLPGAGCSSEYTERGERGNTVHRGGGVEC